MINEAVEGEIQISIPNYAWVKPGEPLWDVDGSKRTDVHMDWIRDLGFDLAEAFRKTADFAVDRLAAGGDGYHPDRFALPILYLYRHAFELRLKELIRLGLRLGVTKPSIKVNKALSREHNLLKLWTRVTPILNFVWPNTDGTEMAQIGEYLAVLDAVDPDGQRLRYDRVARSFKKAEGADEDDEGEGVTLTVDDLLFETKEDRKDRPPAIVTLPDHFGLVALQDRMTKIDHFFESSIDGILYLLDARGDPEHM